MKMDVAVLVDLTAQATAEHIDEMREAALCFTREPQTVRVSVKKHGLAVLAEFTMPKARQRDVVDDIGRRFSLKMEDYGTWTIWFPKNARVGSNAGANFSEKQGQYLAFISIRFCTDDPLRRPTSVCSSEQRHPPFTR